MAKYTFTVESDDLHEVADFINRANVAAPLKNAEEFENSAASEPAPAARPTRARKPKAEEAPATEGESVSSASETESSTATTGTSNPASASPEATEQAEEHPLLKEYSLGDIKAKATELITAGGGEVSVKIVNNLKERFGAEGFGQLKPEDYGRCMAMLDEVGS